jgi:hypothetical protein
MVGLIHHDPQSSVYHSPDRQSTIGTPSSKKQRLTEQLFQVLENISADQFMKIVQVTAYPESPNFSAHKSSLFFVIFKNFKSTCCFKNSNETEPTIFHFS